MSVPKDKRSSGELAINTSARSICTHVLKITGNQNRFPPGQEWFLDKFREMALDIDLDCWKANNIYADSEERYEERMALQQRAADSCTEMLELINIARGLYHMDTKRYRNLTDQYSGLRKDIRNWHKSDRERLKPVS